MRTVLESVDIECDDTGKPKGKAEEPADEQ